MADNQIPNAAFPNENLQKTGLQICDVNSTFNVNSILSAVQTYTALNYITNKLVGMDTKWFRAIPQQRAKDVIFQEYTLSNVEETPLCVKVVLPNGNFPDSKYNYDLMGLEYEVPLEIHIDKRYWEDIAGQGTAPQKKDIVYFMTPNKLYQVESAYLFRGFMEQETTWKLNLRKYMPESSRRESTALQETIDKYTVSTEELFGAEIDANVEKLTDDKQFSPMNSTSKDKYKTLDSHLKIVTQPINIYGTTVAQSYYDMSTAEYFSAINYVGLDTIATTMDRSITAWAMPRTIDKNLYDINNITTDPSGYLIQLNTNTQFVANDTFIIYRAGALNFYAIVIDTLGSSRYKCKIDQPVVDYMNAVKSDWMTVTNYKMQLKDPINLLDGVDAFNDSKFTVNIYANQFIKVNYGTQEYIAIIDEKLNDDEWHAFVINIGNTWRQYSAYVWKKHESDENAKLQNIFYETMTFVPEDVAINHYNINRSPSYLTNIRLYTTTIEDERQSNSLLSIFSPDADQAKILDNCDPILKIPYISKQK
ncbi:MAG: hypothetical protein WC554_15760 [Clostridia bacterium]